MEARLDLLRCKLQQFNYLLNKYMNNGMIKYEILKEVDSMISITKKNYFIDNSSNSNNNNNNNNNNYNNIKNNRTEPTITKTKICSFWSRNGRCKFGANCWFYHKKINYHVTNTKNNKNKYQNSSNNNKNKNKSNILRQQSQSPKVINNNNGNNKKKNAQNRNPQNINNIQNNNNNNNNHKPKSPLKKEEIGIIKSSESPKPSKNNSNNNNKNRKYLLKFPKTREDDIFLKVIKSDPMYFQQIIPFCDRFFDEEFFKIDNLKDEHSVEILWGRFPEYINYSKQSKYCRITAKGLDILEYIKDIKNTTL